MVCMQSGALRQLTQVTIGLDSKLGCPRERVETCPWGHTSAKRSSPGEFGDNLLHAIIQRGDINCAGFIRQQFFGTGIRIWRIQF